MWIGVGKERRGRELNEDDMTITNDHACLLSTIILVSWRRKWLAGQTPSSRRVGQELAKLAQIKVRLCTENPVGRLELNGILQTFYGLIGC